MRRAIPLALVLVVATVAAVLVGGSGGGYRIRIELTNGSQLVKGNRITVGGRQVGLVDDIRLTDDNLAEVTATLDAKDLLPLHAGTTATVRAPSLAGVANRYIALDPGLNDAPALRSGTIIPVAHTRSSVEVDELLNTFDAQTRGALQAIVDGGAEQYRGVGAQANQALAALNPAFAQLEATAHEVGASSARLERLLTTAATVADAVDAGGAGSRQVTAAIVRTAQLARALGGARGDLDRTLAGAPAALRAATGTLRHAARTARVLRPAAREAAAAAPDATRLASALRSTLGRAVVTVPSLRRVAAALAPVLRRMPSLARTAAPALGATTGALSSLAPISAAVRAYMPDVIGGVLGGLGGSTSGYYDANGHYLRLGINASLLSIMGLGALLPTTAVTSNDLLLTRTGQDARCPGAATQPAADHSNPWVTPEAPCDPKDSP